MFNSRKVGSKQRIYRFGFQTFNARRQRAFRCIQLNFDWFSITTDSHFANYRFSFRKLQILISQTTDFHFAN